MKKNKEFTHYFRSKKHTFHFISSGFSLIELTVSMALFAILTAGIISFINPSSQIKKGSDGRRKADLIKIQAALLFYHSENGNYPLTNNFTSALTQGSPRYMDVLPTDPTTGLSYGYVALPSSPTVCDNSSIPCTGYQLYACLENVNDPEVDPRRGILDACPSSSLVSYSVFNP